MSILVPNEMKRSGKLFIVAHLINTPAFLLTASQLWMSVLASFPARRCLPIAGLPCAVAVTSRKPFVSLLFSPSFSEMPGMKQGSRAPQIAGSLKYQPVYVALQQVSGGGLVLQA